MKDQWRANGGSGWQWWIMAAALSASPTWLSGGCEPAARQPTAETQAARSSDDGRSASVAADSASAADELPSPAKQPVTGPELYAQHCAACHGEKGDGKGIAAAMLFPKPRDFRAGRFRLVSTTNTVPTDEDVRAVLVRGMPGSSMPPWPHLGEQKIGLLVGEVMRLRKVGLREDTIQRLKDEDEEVDEADVDATVANLTEPGELSELPKIDMPDEAAIARGKELYVKQSCHACHGKEGRGDGAQVMVDAEGLATKPRDFLGGVFKGGHDPASLYRRIHLGMPGTPMPSSGGNLKPEQIVDLVHFIRSMSDEATREAQILKRETLLARRVPKLPASDEKDAWGAVPETAIRTMPLWWRDNARPDLHVQAVHDGKTIAVRFAWADVTENRSAVHPDEFEDLAAMQLSAAGAEPFLGMGAGNSFVDLWQWRGGIADRGESQWQSDEYPFESPIYIELAKGKPLPDFITAHAAGNPLAVREISGSNLTAKGPGSITFRPKASQLVTSDANWKDGRWSVVLYRTLNAPGNAGLSLIPGKPYSAAFALWDGAAHDRGGQKMISIWQDLSLE